MKIKNIIIVFALILVGLSACKKESVIELGTVYPMSGEWYVTAQFDDGSGVVDDHYGLGYFLLTTSNTAANTENELLIMDDANFWWFKVKSALNLEAKTFSATNVNNLVPEEDYGSQITISVTSGNVIIDGGLSTDENVTDSIYMEVEYSDDPGTVYQISGVRRTGFLEDEH